VLTSLCILLLHFIINGLTCEETRFGTLGQQRREKTMSKTLKLKGTSAWILGLPINMSRGMSLKPRRLTFDVYSEI
jgi:hypothetical protein